MKLQQALEIIEVKEKGFMVHFEKREGHTLSSDMFPDIRDGEEPIKTEDEAWELATRFARATDDNYVNIYVIDHKFRPVADYVNKAFKRE